MEKTENPTDTLRLEKRYALRLELQGEAETIDLGHTMASLLRAQSTARPQVTVFLLYGDLGSGKTTFARGFTAALPGGDQAEVASPSFTLCNIYPTTPPLVHCDLYRLPESAALPEEAEDALELGGMVLVEWAERLSPQDLPPERLDIMLQSCKENRLATLLPHGAAARRILSQLARIWSQSHSATRKD